MDLNSLSVYMHVNACDFDFSLSVQEHGPQFFVEPPPFGFPIGYEPDGTPIYPSPPEDYVYPAYGECSVQKGLAAPIDEAGTTTTNSIYRQFSSDTVNDCLEEIMKSNAINECNSTTYEN